jgi:chemotaxis methyl-accepting protein methylase
MGNMTEENEELQRLLDKIYQERDFDLRGYKETVLTRRLGRRLHARGVDTYARYSHVLDQDPIEYDRLFNDLTIKVSSFLRDDAAFQMLEKTVLPTLVNQRTRNIRIWSAGCATGEEPYSIAMLLLEIVGQGIGLPDGIILATDVDTNALERAREGWYSEKSIDSIRPAWLDKYFVAERSGFRIQPIVRRLVFFEKHNLVSDPPCHDFDLVLCRNVLIYFDPTLQMKVLKNFHEVLKEGGFLLLGKAEVPVGETRALFSCVDIKAKLFRKAGVGQKRQGNSRVSLNETSATGEYQDSVPGVIVIGSSAGGIDALTQVLSGFPVDLPAAVLIAQHLRSDRESRLPEHLARHSQLRVCHAQNGLPLEPGVVYVAVPGKHLCVENRRLVLNLGEPVHYVRPSVDVLFSSAAQAFGCNVIGVILSGSGCDGAAGCRIIKARGGVTIAQNENTSYQFAMPKAAIDAGVVDYILPVEHIAGKIVSLASGEL